jgi:glycosyltransferase involved in cell wall biosynthesis
VVNKKKYKLVLAYSFTPSAWVSCQSIVENLRKSYHHSGVFEILDINIASDLNSYEELVEIEKIKDFNPDKLVFIDHLPHPIDFLEKYKVLISKELPDCIFHVFGDFTLNLNNWLSVKDILDGSNAQFVCASEKQTLMISELLNGSSLSTIEFPVLDEIFFFDEVERESKRRLLGWEGSIVLLYTGRLSRQKNILELLLEFSKFISSNADSGKMKLVFVGEFDELGEPFKDRSEWKEEYFHEVYDFYLNLDEDVRMQIEFYPFQDSKELFKWYSASDYLINLSSHNDEDFGMSCAEALFCSLPIIITNWAGFSSFKRLNGDRCVQYIDVELKENHKYIHFSKLQEILSSLSSDKKILRSYSSFIRRELSVENISSKIELLVDTKSKKMCTTKILSEAALLETNYYGEVFYNTRERAYRDIYFYLYSHYASKV